MVAQQTYWPVFRLSYVSRAAQALDVSHLMEVASVCEADEGAVTGVLVQSGAEFVQVLEGEEAAVMAAYRKIAEDARYCDVAVVATEITEARRFAEWGVTCFSIRKDDLPEGFLLDGESPIGRAHVDAFDQIEGLIQATFGARGSEALRAVAAPAAA